MAAFSETEGTDQGTQPCGEDPREAGNPGGLRCWVQVCPNYEASG